MTPSPFAPSIINCVSINIFKSPRKISWVKGISKKQYIEKEEKEQEKETKEKRKQNLNNW